MGSPDHRPPSRLLVSHGQTMFAFRRGDIRLGTVLACVPALVGCLFGGILLGEPMLGTIAASGAFAVGFGASQRFTRFRAAPMGLAALGMAVAAGLGSGAGLLPPVFLLLAAVMGAATGGAIIAGAGAWWIVLQWAIAFLVAGSFPSGLDGALERAALVLGGGVLQMVVVTLAWALMGESAIFDDDAGKDRLSDLFRFVAHSRDDRAETIRVAAASGLMTVAGTALWLVLGVPNGYWIPVTSLIILRPQATTTVERTVYRIAGTIAGSGLATLITALLRPGQHLIAAMAILFAGTSYFLARSGYAFFAASVTACVAFLVSLSGLPELIVVEHRIIANIAGGSLALLAALVLRGRES